MPNRTKRADAAHDVLAAEEFGVPAPDPSLHHGPIKLPDDPTGIAEPHDVLAAEEFAMPAPPQGTTSIGLAQRAHSSRRTLAFGGVAMLALLRLVRRRRRRR